MDDFHVIVFSKDRAFQLHEYLRTLRKYITASSGHVRVSVLYHAAKPELECRCHSFDKSYERVRALHSDVSFVPESCGVEFAQKLREIVSSAPAKQPGQRHGAQTTGSRYVLFGVDDALFFAPFNLTLGAQFLSHRPNSHFAFHLKLHPGVQWCHPAGQPAVVPPLESIRFRSDKAWSEPVLAFRVGGTSLASAVSERRCRSVDDCTQASASSRYAAGTHDWAYPWDLCGTMYRTDDVIAMLNAIATQGCLHQKPNVNDHIDTNASTSTDTAETTGTDPDSAFAHPNLLEANGARLLLKKPSNGSASAHATKLSESECAAAAALRQRALVCGCPSHPIMVVITVNRVQDVYKNRVWGGGEFCAAASADASMVDSDDTDEILLALDRLLWMSPDLSLRSSTGAFHCPTARFDDNAYASSCFTSVHVGAILLTSAVTSAAEASTSTSKLPLVSVLLPVRNGERFLMAALRSVAAQVEIDCGFELELIAVDDGSSDRTPAILDEASHWDCFLRCVVLSLGSDMYPEDERLAHGGVCGALRAALNEAKGDFVARIDADDVWLAGRVARQLKRLMSEDAIMHNVAVIGSAVELINDDAETSLDTNALRRKVLSYPSHPTLATWALLFGCSPVHSAVLCRTEALRAVGGYTSKATAAESAKLRLAGFPDAPLPAFQHAEDYHLWLRLAFPHCDKTADISRQVTDELHAAERAAAHTLPPGMPLLNKLSSARAAAQKRADMPSLQAWRIVNVPDVLVQHRKHSSSVTGNKHNLELQKNAALRATALAMASCTGRPLSCMCVRVAKHGISASDIEDDKIDGVLSEAFAVIKDLEKSVLCGTAGPYRRMATDSLLSQIHSRSICETADNARRALTVEATARQGELAVLSLQAQLPCASLLLAQWAKRGKSTTNSEFIRSHGTGDVDNVTKHNKPSIIQGEDSSCEDCRCEQSSATADDDDQSWSVTELD